MQPNDAVVPVAGAASTLPWAGQPYSIKRHGVSITNCDTEPVQTPGCVQAHGALLVLRHPALTIAQASENCAAVLGHDVAELLQQPVSRVLGAAGAERLAEVLASDVVECNRVYLFSQTGAGGALLDAVVHTLNGSVMLEFEPSVPAAAAASGSRSPQGEAGLYAVLKSAMARLQTAVGLQPFCDALTQQVREMTGLDRVMVYKFHPDLHGEVIAEASREDLPSWLGLHYPAADIPLPAREIFKRVWVRPVPDVSGVLAEMVPLVHPDTGVAVEMTHCSLRGPSVMYTEYLRNMGVTACLTMPIRSDAELWGLIACHHYAGEKALSFHQRTACEFIAQVASVQFRDAEKREQLQSEVERERISQTLLARATGSGSLASIGSGEISLKDALPCSGAALWHDGRWHCDGQTPPLPQLEALATWLSTRPEFDNPLQRLFASDRLSADFPGAVAYTELASGLLAVPLGPSPGGLMMWFRPPVLQEIRWAGNPHDKPTVVGPHGPRLTPRASFEIYAESVRGRSSPWLGHEKVAATRLRVLAMEWMVARAQQLAALNDALTRSNEDLDAFAHVASHDLKEPLRGIHRYAHQLREDARILDEDQQRKLENLLSLTVRMDGLLDALLLFSRVGRESLELEECGFDAILDEALEMVGSRRAETHSEIVVPRPFGRVRCDWVRCREILVNLLSNALKYNDKSPKRIEIGWIGANETPRASAPKEAADQTVFYVRDNGIGIEARHHEQVFLMFKRLHKRDAFGGGSGAGLTIVKKLVERHGGAIWLESEPGRGSTFYFTIPGPSVGAA